MAKVRWCQTEAANWSVEGCEQWSSEFSCSNPMVEPRLCRNLVDDVCPTCEGREYLGTLCATPGCNQHPMELGPPDDKGRLTCPLCGAERLVEGLRPCPDCKGGE